MIRRTTLDPELVFEHYMNFIEREPERLLREQTHCSLPWITHTAPAI